MLESALVMNPLFLILASNSPRRRQLIQLLGIPFEVHPEDVDESQLDGENAEDYVRRLARSKAEATVGKYADLVVAADTIVVDGEAVLGKPTDATDACAMLTRLRSRQHQVFSAFALYKGTSLLTPVEVCKTGVFMRRYSDTEMEEYIASGDPLDKAGGYGIQNRSFKPVTSLNGCYASVMGLPLCHLTRTLLRHGIAITADVPALCQAMLDYRCPVYGAILAGQD